MASRFWVGGTGNWDAGTTTHWSATSGGGGGASVPTSSDDVTIDTNSGIAGGTISMTAALNTAACNNLVTSVGSAWTLTSVSDNLKVFGNITLESGLTTTGNMVFTMSATGTGHTVVQNSATLDGGYEFNGVGGGWKLLDNCVIASIFKLTNGAFDANGFSVTTLQLSSNNSNTRTLTMGSGTWSLGSTAPWNVTNTGLTFNANTSTVKVTNSSNTNSSLSSGGLTFHNFWYARGARTGTFTITGSNTFNDFKDTGTVAHTLIFTAGTTQHFSTFTVGNNPSAVVTINSQITSTHALVKDGGGTISTDYLNIQHSVATPTSTWYAGTHSTNNQAVATAGSGWIFTAAPATNGGFLTNML